MAKIINTLKHLKPTFKTLQLKADTKFIDDIINQYPLSQFLNNENTKHHTQHKQHKPYKQNIEIKVVNTIIKFEKVKFKERLINQIIKYLTKINKLH